MDGVLADFHGHMATILDCRWDNEPGVDGFPPDILTRYGGVDDIWHHVNCYHRDFWSEIPVLPWAEELLTAVDSLFPGRKKAILTHPQHDEVCFTGKFRWWASNLRPLLGSFPLRLYADKHEVGQPGYLLIDDHAPTVDMWRERGGSAILFARPWNREYARAHETLHHTIQQLVALIDAELT